MQQRSERTETHNEAPTNMSDSKATQQREGFPFCTHKQLLKHKTAEQLLVSRS